MTLLKFTPKSTMVKSVEYNQEEKNLFATFKNGAQYKYEDVSLELYNQFKAHESTGKAVKELLSDKKYQRVY
jgi:hypothetical protein